MEIAHRNDRAAVAEQRVNHAMNQEPPKRLTDPRAAYDARTTQIHAKLAQLLQLADDHSAMTPTPSTGATPATRVRWSRRSSSRS